jgi:ubiquinone/menaquinone biosynthesis C-methylase UbiE
VQEDSKPDVYATIAETDPAMLEQLSVVLEVRAADPQQAAMRDAYLAALSLPEEARVLGVGCGTGAVTRALARLPGIGAVVGLDPSPTFLAKARALAGALPQVTFVESEARALPFADATFDAVIFHTMLCHLPAPERALAEAFRVLRAGGWLAAFDGDYATTTVATGDYDPLQTCVEAYIALVHDPWLVRHLPALVRAAGFALAEYRGHSYVQTAEPSYMLTLADRGADALQRSGRIGQPLAEALNAEARRRVETGEFFGHIAYASVLARKPE